VLEAGGIMDVDTDRPGDGVGRAQTRTSQRVAPGTRLPDFAGTGRVGETRRCRREVRLT